ncbi:MAG TPA: TauD/TfdA family dioxygenase [Burkholderiales bacterium]
MALSLRPLHPLFVAEASGIDLRKTLTRTDARDIEAAMDRHAVLVWRGQPLTEDQQVAFSANFGPLDQGLKKARKLPTRNQREETIDISNVDPNGRVYGREHAKIVSNLANQLWHSDSSFQSMVAKYSMLSAVVVPAEGGQTEFADLRAAWDALPQALQKAVEGRVAQHFAFHSRLWLGDTSYTEDQLRGFPPVEWPLVRVHPGSQRKLLFVGIHCTHVVGMTVPEGRMLLADLLEHATQREFVYRHEWKAGDLVMWDNRATVHRGRHWDLSVPRELRRTTTEDVGSRSLQPA